MTPPFSHHAQIGSLLPLVPVRQWHRPAQGDRSAGDGSRQVIARAPFQASNRTANASSRGPATAPAAPTNNYNPHSYGQIPIEPVDR